MASSKCSVVDCKRNVNNLCDHCQQWVCTKHYIEHVQLANNELPELSEQLDAMMKKMEEHDFTRCAFEQIDQWREESYRRIDELCEERKQQVKTEITDKIGVQMVQLRELVDEVKKLIDEGDASVKEITNIKENLEKFDEQCRQLERNDYFQLDIKGINLGATLCNHQFFQGGTLLSLEHQLKLNEFYGKEGQTWQLIYKATRDGFPSADFHRCCNNQGPTISVIQSIDGNYLFGGYTSVSWSSRQGYVPDNNGPFLFTLTNSHDIPPTKYPVKLRNHAVYDHANHGPTFGAGFDLCVNGQNRDSDTNSFNFPHSYVDTTKQGALTFTGNRNFRMNDLEVYQRTQT